ncbi:helix-turn-helix transcriptional regulator [Salinithrix halophila]|uniref:Helix-turn-helix transcriptional regulator n=1 Tax=Salinithrix halophila TaxID=1485204 RepID=A0ABV8JL89_9BACL
MSVKHILLGVLSWAPNSGYGIKSEVEYYGRELGWGRVSFGSIYPQLKKLEHQGFIKTESAEEDGRKTKIYELTAKGWRELSNWLEQPPVFPEVRDELLMKLSFWDTGKPEDRELLMDHLELRRKETKQMLHHFEQWSTNGYSAISEIGGLEMDYLKDRLRFDMEWYERMIRQLERPPTSPRQDPRGLFKKASQRKKHAFSESKDMT